MLQSSLLVITPQGLSLSLSLMLDWSLENEDLTNYLSYQHADQYNDINILMISIIFTYFQARHFSNPGTISPVEWRTASRVHTLNWRAPTV